MRVDCNPIITKPYLRRTRQELV